MDICCSIESTEVTKLPVTYENTQYDCDLIILSLKVKSFSKFSINYNISSNIFTLYY